MLIEMGVDISFEQTVLRFIGTSQPTCLERVCELLGRPADSYLVFDSDLNPEGVALSYDSDRAFAMLGGFWVDERAIADDAILYALQGGYRASIADGIGLTIGAGYLNYTQARGFAPFYLGLAQGNSVDGAGNLLYDYDIVEVFAELEFDLAGRPLLLFVDYAENTEADDLETGYGFGARWGRTSTPGSWEITWAYEELQADAVVASFTDSNFAGGGTDGTGHVLYAAYQLRDNVRLNGKLLVNERGEAAGNKRDYSRLQLDISFLF
jgi:hypothetical protein